ncbi:MAG: hypothetical protein KJ050_04935, partial [Candidatus Omnitrophica bacterium]|nr:hypothetical protein [Candidatus Omnitrophota bacterium]
MRGAKGVSGAKGFSGAKNVAPTPGSSHPLCQWAGALRLPRSLSHHPHTLYSSSSLPIFVILA